MHEENRHVLTRVATPAVYAATCFLACGAMMTGIQYVQRNGRSVDIGWGPAFMFAALHSFYCIGGLIVVAAHAACHRLRWQSPLLAVAAGIASGGWVVWLTRTVGEEVLLQQWLLSVVPVMALCAATAYTDHNMLRRRA